MKSPISYPRTHKKLHFFQRGLVNRVFFDCICSVPFGKWTFDHPRNLFVPRTAKSLLPGFFLSRFVLSERCLTEKKRSRPAAKVQRQNRYCHRVCLLIEIWISFGWCLRKVTVSLRSSGKSTSVHLAMCISSCCPFFLKIQEPSSLQTMKNSITLC